MHCQKSIQGNSWPKIQCILLEEEIDIEAAWYSIFLQLDLVMVFSVMKLMQVWRDNNEDAR